MLAFFLIGFVSSFAAASSSPGNVLTRAAGCANCHTVDFRQPMAGGLAMATPFGTFYTPNITPDPATGIGTWSLAQFSKALRKGVDPHGELLYPAFPYRAYSKLTDDDVRLIYDELMALPPVRKPNIPHQLAAPFRWRWTLSVWRRLYFRRFGNTDAAPQRNAQFSSGRFEPSATRSAEWNRGAYLVEAVAHCTECHTPRDPMGGLKTAKWMAGTIEPVTGEVIPNLTPDKQTGLGHWSKTDWVRFLESGLFPDPETPQLHGEMAHVIQNTASLTKKDRAAVAEYMSTLSPVANPLPARGHK